MAAGVSVGAIGRAQSFPLLRRARHESQIQNNGDPRLKSERSLKHARCLFQTNVIYFFYYFLTFDSFYFHIFDIGSISSRKKSTSFDWITMRSFWLDIDYLMHISLWSSFYIFFFIFGWNRNTVEDDFEWIETEFDETVEMSTYLVALVVSDFKCIKTVARPSLFKPINVSLCARPNAISQLNFALNVTVKALEFFENLFEIVYPLPKSGKKNKSIIFLPHFLSFLFSNLFNRGKN